MPDAHFPIGFVSAVVHGIGYLAVTSSEQPVEAGMYLQVVWSTAMSENCISGSEI